MKSRTNEELTETKDHFKQQKRLENLANYNTINQSAFNHLFPNLQKEYQISRALSTLLFDLVDINKADVLEKILKSTNSEQHLKRLKNYDPVRIDSVYLRTGSIFKHALLNDYSETVEVLLDNGCYPQDEEYWTLKLAIYNNAKHSIAILLKKYKLTEERREELAELAREEGNITILNLIMPNNDSKESLSSSQSFYLKTTLNEIQHKKESLYKLDGALSKAFLSSNLNDIEKLCTNLKTYLRKDCSHLEEKEREKYIAQIENSYDSLFSWGSLITRYLTQSKREELTDHYGAESDWKTEKNHGLDNYKIAMNAQNEAKSLEMSGKFKHYFGTGSLARCLNYLSIKHAEEAKNRAREDNNPLIDSCTIIREDGVYSRTPVKFNRYNNMQQYAYYLFENPTEDMQLEKNGYWLKYGDQLVTFVEFLQGPADIFLIKNMPEEQFARHMEFYLGLKNDVVECACGYESKQIIKITKAEFIEEFGEKWTNDFYDTLKNSSAKSNTKLLDSYRFDILQILAKKKEAPDNYFSKKIHCHHGKFPVNTYWKKLESLFQEIKDLKPENYPKDFYDKLSEFSWLFGNTTPMRRGSGYYVELLLVILQKFNHFRPLILKAGLQRDCLNIFIPLSLYKKVFLFFVEPSSLPTWAIEQMEKTYNEDKYVRAFVDKFKLHSHYNLDLRDEHTIADSTIKKSDSLARFPGFYSSQSTVVPQPSSKKNILVEPTSPMQRNQC